MENIDKTGWADGPWMRESDRIELSVNCQYPCLILRSNIGHLCGYVAVDKSHPSFGRAYSDVAVTCHGGLTFGENGKTLPAKWFHSKVTKTEDVHWFGFDCGHICDYSPGLNGFMGDTDVNSYRTLYDVACELSELAEQFAEMESVQKLIE